LDKEKIDNEWSKGSENVIDIFLKTPFHELVEDKDKRNKMYTFFNPNSMDGDNSHYHNSQKVLDVMVLLRDLLDEEAYPNMRNTIVTAVCTLEGISDRKHLELLKKDAHQLVKTLISGDEEIASSDEGERSYRTLFAPVPNLIFTRDIGVVTNNHILISNAAKRARQRESLFVKYIFKYHKAFIGKDEINENVLELADDEINLDKDLFYVQDAASLNQSKDLENEPKIAVEGGDVMMLNGKYLLIGRSERTNSYAVKKIAQQVFEKQTGLEKVISVKIPNNRSSMHLDTIMTQTDTHDWVIYTPFIAETKTDVRIYTAANFKDKNVPTIQKTITQVLEEDIYEGKEKVNFIHSGNRQFPYDRREQWTDGCNLLALMPGICIGYDRNVKTSDAFRNAGYRIVQARSFIKEFILEQKSPEDYLNEKIILLLPSGELSRARGGSHCMSMPLLRD
jgi:arginine deiminase